MITGVGRFLIGLLAGLCVIPAVIFVYFHFGFAPVETSAGAMPFEKSLARMALHARIAREAPKETQVPVTAANLVAGAKVYRDYCMACHGAASGPRTALQQGMYPRPPLLLQGKGVTDDPVGQTYWVVKHGIRTTGMPAFEHALTDLELWQVSLLAANAQNLPPAASASISQPPAGLP
jgi:thiosulfate dehydrogenase